LPTEQRQLEDVTLTGSPFLARCVSPDDERISIAADSVVEQPAEIDLRYIPLHRSRPGNPLRCQAGAQKYARRATQRSVKFVRWIRQSIRDQAAESLDIEAVSCKNLRRNSY
jgi:hypothetical protein